MNDLEIRDLETRLVERGDFLGAAVCRLAVGEHEGILPLTDGDRADLAVLSRRDCEQLVDLFAVDVI